MLTTLIFVLSTSYIAWYLEKHEIAAVYPFDETYATPAQAGAQGLTEATVETQDGARLIVWRAEAAADHPTVIYFSGNAGALKDRAPRLAQISAEGYGVIAPAYRGSSGSTGAPEEAVLVSDAIALAEGLQGDVILYGESLGAAIAIRLAADGIGQAVVLEAPFTSLGDLVAAQFPTEDLTGILTQRWDSLSLMSALSQPLMVIHGETDRVVPHRMGRAIFEAAGSTDKTFLSVSEQGHNGLWTDAVRSDIFAFLQRDFRE
ncbi:MAG: alpha/beta fold hydrolase [Pseudomonadota bacterium]